MAYLLDLRIWLNRLSLSTPPNSSPFSINFFIGEDARNEVRIVLWGHIFSNPQNPLRHESFFRWIPSKIIYSKQLGSPVMRKLQYIGSSIYYFCIHSRTRKNIKASIPFSTC